MVAQTCERTKCCQTERPTRQVFCGEGQARVRTQQSLEHAPGPGCRAQTRTAGGGQLSRSLPGLVVAAAARPPGPPPQSASALPRPRPRARASCGRGAL